MTSADWLLLLHPMASVIFVFPLVGIVTHYALQTRQRRLSLKAKEKSKIPPMVGAEHVKVGRWLTAAVVGVALMGLAYPIHKAILRNDVWSKDPFQGSFIVAMFALTVAALALLYRAQGKLWRGLFATLSSAGLIILGLQDGVFRRSNEWFISHYYYGITAAILMIAALAMLPEVSRSLTWRRVHIAINCLALLLFVGQGVTGARDLFEIGLYMTPPQ